MAESETKLLEQWGLANLNRKGPHIFGQVGGKHTFEGIAGLAIKEDVICITTKDGEYRLGNHCNGTLEQDVNAMKAAFNIQEPS